MVMNLSMIQSPFFHDILKCALILRGFICVGLHNYSEMRCIQKDSSFGANCSSNSVSVTGYECTDSGLASSNSTFTSCPQHGKYQSCRPHFSFIAARTTVTEVHQPQCYGNLSQPKQSEHLAAALNSLGIWTPKQTQSFLKLILSRENGTGEKEGGLLRCLITYTVLFPPTYYRVRLP